MAGDASWASVNLLLKFEGANLSTVFTDKSSSPKTVTPNSGAKISTAHAAFGASAGLFNGSSDFLSIPNAGMYPTLLAEDFTVEAWVYVTAYPAAGTVSRIAGLVNSGGGNENWSLVFRETGTLSFSIFDSAFRSSTTTNAIALNTWTHVGGVKVGANVYALVGGTRSTTPGTLTGNPIAPGSTTLSIGRMGDYVGQFFGGYIDEFRLTKGVARYTGATYTVPTESFPEGMGLVSGIVKDSAGSNVARTVRAYRRDTGAAVGSAVSDATSGAYSIWTPTLDEVSLICLDDAAGTVENDLVLRAVPA